MIGVIIGTGSCVPKKVVHNRELEQFLDTSDAWIQERTGVVNRHIIEEETTTSMAAEAARRALENAKVKASDIDMIVVATMSSDTIMPNTACAIQKEIGAEHAVCFDLNAACSGFVFAYNTVQAYIAMGHVKAALVIGAESLSNLLNWTDRGTCILFGDGAGAVVVQAEREHNMVNKSEIRSLECVMHAMGNKGQALTCVHQYCKENEEESKESYLKMDGQEVFKFAIRQVPNAIEELIQKMQMKKSDFAIQDIDYFVLHQANKRIVETVAKKLKVDIEKFPMNLQEYGNTSSASIPILLDEMNRKGMLKSGMKIIIAGFGAGLTWGATYLEWK